MPAPTVRSSVVAPLGMQHLWHRGPMETIVLIVGREAKFKILVRFDRDGVDVYRSDSKVRTFVLRFFSTVPRVVRKPRVDVLSQITLLILGGAGQKG